MTDRMESVELLGCPFCGKRPISRWNSGGEGMDDCGYWGIECCGAFCHQDDEATAARIWNTRASPAGGESEAVAWMVERETDPTFPRLFDDESDAFTLIAHINVSPPATIKPLYATPPAAAQSVNIDATVAATANSIMAIRMMVDERAEPFVRKELEALIRAVQSGGCPEELVGGHLDKLERDFILDGVVIEHLKKQVETQAAQLEATRKALEESQSLIVMINHLGSGGASVTGFDHSSGITTAEWDSEGLSKMTEAQIAENRAALEGTQS